MWSFRLLFFFVNYSLYANTKPNNNRCAKKLRFQFVLNQNYYFLIFFLSLIFYALQFKESLVKNNIIVLLEFENKKKQMRFRSRKSRIELRTSSKVSRFLTRCYLILVHFLDKIWYLI